MPVQSRLNAVTLAALIPMLRAALAALFLATKAGTWLSKSNASLFQTFKHIQSLAFAATPVPLQSNMSTAFCMRPCWVHMFKQNSRNAENCVFDVTMF